MEKPDVLSKDDKIRDRIFALVAWARESGKIAEPSARIFNIVQQARQDTAREISEDIEKVENPYFLKDIDGDYYNKYPEFEVFEQCRQKILSLFKEVQHGEATCIE